MKAAMSHPEFYNPTSVASEWGLAHSIAGEAGQLGGARSVFRPVIGPSNAFKSLQMLVRAMTPCQSYPITKPNKPYVKFGMTHDWAMRDQNGDVGAALSRRAFATEIPITRCNSCVGAGILQNVSTAIGFVLLPGCAIGSASRGQCSTDHNVQEAPQNPAGNRHDRRCRRRG
jgi:hypothetical protein